MKKTTLLFCYFLYLISAYAQSSESNVSNKETKHGINEKPAQSAVSIKPIKNDQNQNNTGLEVKVEATQPTIEESFPPFKSNTPVTKYELYSLLKKHLEANNYKNWIVAERLSNFYVIYKEPVIIVPEKGNAEYESEAKENEALSKLYTPKTFEIAIEFTAYDTESLFTQSKDNKVFQTQPEELKSLYQMEGIFENTETKEYYAMDNDERNRLSKYMLAKVYLDNSPGKESPNLYVQNFTVTLKYPSGYYRTIPVQVNEEAIKIIQFVENTLRNNQ